MDKKTALIVQRTDPETAVAFIRRYHYSKVLPRLTRHYLGIYRGGQLSGVVLLGWGDAAFTDDKKDFPTA